LPIISFSKKEQGMIDKAFEMSLEATHKHRMGCVIFDKKIQHICCNSNKTHPGLPGKVDKLHAEMRALKHCLNSEGSVMIIVRGTQKKPLLAKPCKHCFEQIKNAKIRKIIYSTYDGFEMLKL
jgi:deoxycytidylate deaminase